MEKTVYAHPNPTAYRLTQWIIFLGMCVLLLAVPLQLLIALTYPQAILFYLLAVITLILIAPLLLYLLTTPTVTIDAHGITVHPFIGKPFTLAWDDIDVVKPYPLLPRQNHEVNKRLVVGRKRYKPAEGLMLVSSQLPLFYLIGGVFAGERGRKIIAVTNRTHTHYDKLTKQVMHFTQTDTLDT